MTHHLAASRSDSCHPVLQGLGWWKSLNRTWEPQAFYFFSRFVMASDAQQMNRPEFRAYGGILLAHQPYLQTELGFLKSLMHWAGPVARATFPTGALSGAWKGEALSCVSDPISACMTQKACKCPRMALSIESKKHVESVCLATPYMERFWDYFMFGLQEDHVLKKERKRRKKSQRQWYHVTKRLG